MTMRIWGDEQIKAVLQTTEGSMKLPGGAVVKGGSRGIRSGDLLAYTDITAGDGVHLQVCKYTLVTAASGASDISVLDAHPFEVGDNISIGSDDEVIQSINYETNVITIVSTATVAADDVVVPSSTTTEEDHAVAIAGVPLVHREAYRAGKVNLVTPVDDALYGDAYLMGVFYLSVLQDGNFNANAAAASPKADLNGRINTESDTYIISVIPSTYVA